ncbi:PSP1 C-terminal conserved region-domain-containing protein [Syncephalastrum racemosum]|uniref:PSP1 C-terminal conserved region-domain-containing protein n=1 Tax=Syncephalastrum racemosum TaxID=13706 RepID=A0A1X2HWL0_SYNRA|nr:PSP1 C-terminal conserved region-domain-containing protein [Syncephalastrum racemosum]
MYQRRHSLAAPATASVALNNEQLIEELQRLGVDDPNQPPQSDIAAQYPPDKMGKGVVFDQIPHDAVFYVIDFKGARSDLFFSVQQPPFKSGDLVLVEADRGHDLGKVKSVEQRPQLDRLVPANEEDRKKDVHVKRALRAAQANEIALMMTKNQDEAKALLVCQSKVKQKRLHMQVVDAEYQWDRRKLTFYFVAERRVDFRDLVRELFKLYKTRIWM